LLRLIIVDGLDGVGKDTHAELIRKRYEKQGETVVVRSHPTSDNYYGRRSKQALLGHGKRKRLEASVFYALDVLRSLRLYYRKAQSDTLIMVRYLMGTAYLPSRLYRLGYHLFARFVPTSEYMFFLDAQPEVLLDRVHRREKVEMFETYDALLKVRSKALDLADGWYVIDTNQSVGETWSDIETVLDTLDDDQV